MQPVTTMIIPAAGFGTRMRGITHGSSKELLEIAGKSALQYALEAGVEAGIKRAGIVIRKGKEEIIHAVHHDPRLAPLLHRLNVEFFYQRCPNGEAGAILEAKDWLGTAPFVVHYPDNILEHYGALTQLIDRFQVLQTDLVLLTPLLRHAQNTACALEPLGEGLYRVRPEVALPSFPHDLRLTGIYVATHAFLDVCETVVSPEKSSEIKDVDIRRHLHAQRRAIYGLDVSARVFDIGNPESYHFCSSQHRTLP